MLAHFQKGSLNISPEAESVIDAGYNVTLSTGNYVIAPKGLLPEVKDKPAQASQEVVRSPEFLEFLKKQGFVLDPKGPDETAAELVEYNKAFAEVLLSIQK